MIERTAEGKFHPYVMDFGLAQDSAGPEHSRTGIIEGTPRYMAPEQARGDTKHLDRRTDIYALGVTLYELLTGAPPHSGAGELELLVAVLTEEPRPLRAIDPSIPSDLEAITLKCLEKEPAARYDSARALAEDLGRYLDGAPVLARHLGPLARLHRRASKNRPLVGLGLALLASVLGFGGYGVRQRLATLQQAQNAKQQAELTERLGQEIKDMEWILRSSRQLPLHDLGNEKTIIRRRMVQLKQELGRYGELGRGLLHYALGRGHLALHEYPQALTELQQAIANGQTTAEVYYALGFVLGKHYEQAMYEARLSGGGDWAKKQLRAIEPKYLTPAIAALQRSRALKGDTPGYLEVLIAYYQRDYDTALRLADEVKKSAPWLYETSKLAGDIHLERALQARDSGQYETAEKEFAASVKHYQEAAAVGQSDAQVYEGLAESWIRQVEMAQRRGRSTEPPYVAAAAAVDKIVVAEPESSAGPLKMAFAIILTMNSLEGKTPPKLQQCLRWAQEALQRQPTNPYASDALANCYSFAAMMALAKGKEPATFLRIGIEILERVINQNPRFLWGLGDLAGLYGIMGRYQLSRGNKSGRDYFEKSIVQYNAAIELDVSNFFNFSNLLDLYSPLISNVDNETEFLNYLNSPDDFFRKCISLNSRAPDCYENYSIIYSIAAQRIFLTGQDPEPFLQKSLASSDTCRQLGGNMLDTEQNAARAHLIAATAQVRHGEDPTPALRELQTALGRCFTLSAQDAMCRTLSAQADWIAADWQTLQHRPATPFLLQARMKAVAATQSPEVYLDKWQVLAETYLRLARAELARPVVREQHLDAGLLAIAQIFPINPNHPLGRAIQGALFLLRAEAAREPGARRSAAQAAVTALEQAIAQDAFLTHDYAPLRAAARQLVSAP